MRRFLVAAAIMGEAVAAAAAPPPPLPTVDKPGSADSPVLKRFEGAIVLQHDSKNLDELSLPLSKLQPVPGKKNSGNNNVAAPKKRKMVQGEARHLLYVTPPKHSSLEVLKHYRDQITAQKGKVLYECQAAECGGNSVGNSLDGGSSMGLAMYLRDGERVTEEPWSVAWCASHVKLSNIRYIAAEIPAVGAHVSVMAATPTEVGEACSALVGRSIALVDVIVGKAPPSR